MPPPSATTLRGSDHLLDQVLAEISERLRAGEPIDVEATCREHSALADQLRAVLPTMQILAAMDASVAPKDSSNSEFRIPNSALETLGDFRILRELGRGGMGIVYEAEQLTLGRSVALKVLPFAGILSDTQLKRFKNEARAAALLDHPNIVSVHSVGCERGVHYYAMQLIEGRSLAEAIEQMRIAECGLRNEEEPSSQSAIRNPKSSIETQSVAALATERTSNPRTYFRRVAELGIEAASALAHAHQTGVIHRDIKPANLLVDATGKLFVTDFGLARLEADASMTATGDLVGTLRYMSPEQVGGSSTGLDHRTDIYSLGVTLYELATGVPTFSGQNKSDLIRRITDEPPRRPRQVRSEIPHDLETIILKATEKDPADRYATADGLADDLRRSLEHQPIRARRPSLIANGRKWLRRHPSLVGAAVLALAVSLAASLLAAGVAQAEQGKTAEALSEKSDALQQAERNLKLANEQRVRARKNLAKAVETVDRMYVSFVKNWLASDTRISNVQFYYLNDALEFYQELTRDLEGDPAERSLLGVAYERIGDIEHFLQNYAAAAEAWQLAANMSETQLALAPDDFTQREYLIRRYAGLGTSLEELGRLNDANENYRRGLGHVQALVRDFPKEPNYQLELARYQLLRAAILARRNQADAAESLAAAAQENLPRLQNPNSDHHLLSIEIGRVVAGIYWRQDRLTEARKLVDAKVRQCRSLRSSEFSDLRPLLLEEVELTVLLGDLASAAGQFEAAVVAYRGALDLKLQTLRAQIEPALFELASLTHELSWDAAWEPGPFIEYIEIAQRLAIVLRQIGRPYEAETLLGDCLGEAAIIDDIEQHVLQYGVAQVNSAALAAELLADSRPADAKKLLAQAVDEWCRILGEFPQAAERYTSGVHGLRGDLAWFRQTFPHEKLVPRPPKEGEESEYGKNAGEETAFGKHAAARLAYRGEAYKWAVERFTAAAEMRDAGQEFDWLYLAMAHAKLDEHDQAQEWLRMANERLHAQEHPDVELIELHDDAVNVMDD